MSDYPQKRLKRDPMEDRGHLSENIDTVAADVLATHRFKQTHIQNQGIGSRDIDLVVRLYTLAPAPEELAHHPQITHQCFHNPHRRLFRKRLVPC